MNIPIETRQTTRTTSHAIRGWLRLFLIELRRSPAIWAALAIALITWWIMRGGMRVGVVRWRDISYVAGDPMIPVSATAAAIAAFVAGRDRRSHIGEQVQATSIDRLGRDFAVALPVLVWCLLGYAAVVASYFVYAVTGATWGGPTWGFVLIPLASMVASVALGWLVGVVIRNRLSPLAAFGLTMLLQASYPATQHYRMVEEILPNGVTIYRYGIGWWRLLIPWEMLGFASVSGVIGLGAFWLVGLALLFWSASGWLHYRSASALACATLAVVIAVGSASALVSGDWEASPRAAYVEPVCTTRLDSQISVCVHPQDAALLDQSADVIADVLAPLEGISGLPSRYEEMQDERVGEGPVYFSLYDETTITNLHLQQAILRDVLQGPNGYAGRIGSAKYVISAWLLQEAGLSPEDVGYGQLLMPLRTVYGVDADVEAGITDPMAWNRQGPSPEQFAVFERDIHAAIDRFSALSPDQQRAWLEANWSALRAGELTLDDLP